MMDEKPRIAKMVDPDYNEQPRTAEIEFTGSEHWNVPPAPKFPHVSAPVMEDAARFERNWNAPKKFEQPKAASIASFRANLEPGERVAVQRLDGKGVAVVIGRVPYDPAVNRQQRRAMERAGQPIPSGPTKG
jgi:hypothetical protein